jgi:preprotein translocase subunit SecG
MYTLFIILIVIASILLTLIVLVQNSKGGGLAAGFSSSNQIMGVRKTTDFLEKATWGLVIFIVVLSVGAVGVHKTAPVKAESEIKDDYQNAKKAAPGVVAPDFGENSENTQNSQESGNK